MSIESRRATIQRLIISEGAAGRPVAEDADFLSLAERWIHREIDMAEMLRLYRSVREERRRQKWDPRPATDVEPDLTEASPHREGQQSGMSGVMGSNLDE